jgi:hypothetical protein
MFLAEHFGWHLVREAGGGTVTAFHLSKTQSPTSEAIASLASPFAPSGPRGEFGCFKGEKVCG